MWPAEIPLWGFFDRFWDNFINWIVPKGGFKSILSGCQTNRNNVVADTATEIEPPKEKPRPCRVHGI